jgi:curli biogenesis system outer membrane secretion channel CsgG
VRRWAPFKITLPISLLLLTGVFLAQAAVAGVEDVDVEATGYGKSRDRALVSALINAVQQTTGVQIDAVQALEKDLIKIVSDSTLAGHQAATIEATREREFLTAAKGYVKSYSILNEAQAEDGSWSTKIKAVVPQYVSVGVKRGTTKLRTMAILPFRIDRRAPATASELKLVDGLANQLMEELTNSKKFRLLDRAFLYEYQSEIGELRSAETHPEDALRLGQKLGADYVVVGNLDDFDIETETKPMYGSNEARYKMEGEIQYRLIEVASKEVVWVGSHSPQHTHQEITRFLGDEYFNRKGLAEKDKAMKAITGQAAGELASVIVEAVYPIRVMDAKNLDSIVISLGMAGLQTGQLLDVYVGQGDLTDPDTGRTFKTAGTKVATIVITEVNPNYSVAKLIDGDGSRVTKLALVKRQSAEDAQDASQKERRETPGSSDRPVSW